MCIIPTSCSRRRLMRFSLASRVPALTALRQRLQYRRGDLNFCANARFSQRCSLFLITHAHHQGAYYCHISDFPNGFRSRARYDSCVRFRSSNTQFFRRTKKDVQAERRNIDRTYHRSRSYLILWTWDSRRLAMGWRGNTRTQVYREQYSARRDPRSSSHDHNEARDTGRPRGFHLLEGEGEKRKPERTER